MPLLKRELTRQPLGVPRINWADQQNNGLVFCAPFSAETLSLDLVSKSLGTRTGLGTFVENTYGRFLKFGTSNYVDYPAKPSGLTTTTPTTIAWTQDPRSASGFGTILQLNVGTAGVDDSFVIYQSTAVDGYQFTAGPTKAAGGAQQWTAVGVVTNNRRDAFVLVAAAGLNNSTNSNWTLYKNGVLVIGGTSVGYGNSTVGGFRVGSLLSGGDPWEGAIGDLHIWRRALTAGEARAWADNVYSTYEPRRIWVPVSAGGASHATTGALAGGGSAIAGSAAHKALHPTSGALAGSAAAIAGAAARTRVHAASGALAGSGATSAGSAARTRAHPAAGTLAAAGATLAAAAARAHLHPSSGVLAGAGAAVAGSAARAADSEHAGAGVLAGGGAAVSGTAVHKRLHAAAGVLAGGGAIVVGVAARSGSGVVTYPADRTMVIMAEARTLAIAAESRTMAIAAETRTMRIRA